MNANFNKYLAIWTAYYSKNTFAGCSMEEKVAKNGS